MTNLYQNIFWRYLERKLFEKKRKTKYEFWLPRYGTNIFKTYMETKFLIFTKFIACAYVMSVYALLRRQQTYNIISNRMYAY